MWPFSEVYGTVAPLRSTSALVAINWSYNATLSCGADGAAAFAMDPPEEGAGCNHLPHSGYQKSRRRPPCRLRAGPEPVRLPNELAVVTVVCRLRKFTWFITLNESARNWNLK